MRFKLVESISYRAQDILAYHGSQRSGLKFRSDYPLYLTNDKDLAVEFARGYGFNYDLQKEDKPTIYTIEAHVERPKIIKDYDEYERLMDITNADWAVEEIEAEGYDSAIYEEDGLIYYMLFNPAQQANVVKEEYVGKEIKEETLVEVYPNKGESKEDFIKRFMKVTKDEYPDLKQRFAVANSYWKRRDKKKINEDSSFKIESGLEEYIDITDNVPIGSSYILRDGRFIDLNRGTHQSLEDLCSEEGFDFSPYKSMIELNDGSVENIPSYIHITHRPNDDEYKGIEKFIDGLKSDGVEVYIDNKYVKYSLKDYISEDIIKRIKRYYASGNLYESRRDKR